MTHSTSHPKLTQLLDFINGKLDENSSSVIETHLQNCDICTQKLEANPQNDTLLELVRSAAKHEEEVTRQFLNKGDIIGDYEILEELGHGGMGSVYRAYDPHLKRDVALKLIPIGKQEEYYRRLRLEAETIARLQHPGIVEIYHIGECTHGLYLVLELLYPGGLHVFGKKQDHQPKWVVALMQQITETIAYAHKEGVIHRDLKPDNILLAPSTNSIHPWDSLKQGGDCEVPQVKITDFGLVKCLDEDICMTRTNIMLGTPGYMAPEQLPDSLESIGPETDIYALGVIMYQLLSGRLPIESDSLMQSIRMLRDEEAPPLRSLNANIPKDLETICQTCLMKRPEKRYSTAKALADDLGRFLQGEPIEARPLNFFQRLYQQTRCKPLLASYFFGLLVLYCLHLIAWQILELPRHNDFLHIYISMMIVICLISILYIQRLLENPNRRRLGEYLYAILFPLLGFIGLAADAGPSSAPIHLYLLIIVAAPFIRFHPHMVWFQTATITLSYLALIIFAWYWHPEQLPSLEHILFFIMSLPLTGTVVHLLLRRSSQF